jgi:hypothetical protein
MGNLPSDRLRENLGALTEKDFAEIDRRLADPNDPVHNEEVEWLPPPPDPFGGNWEWLSADTESFSVPPLPISEPPSKPSVSKAPDVLPFHRRRVLTAIAWAASILLIFSVDRLLLQRGGETDLDAAGARVTPGGALGGQAWTIQIPSSRRAFVTLAVLGPNNLPEYHPESGKLLESGPDKPLGYTFDGRVGDSLFVVLTETPATDVLNNATALAVNARRQSWNDADSFGRFLDETLRSLGFKHFSVRRIPLSR